MYDKRAEHGRDFLFGSFFSLNINFIYFGILDGERMDETNFTCNFLIFDISGHHYFSTKRKKLLEKRENHFYFGVTTLHTLLGHLLYGLFSCHCCFEDENIILFISFFSCSLFSLSYVHVCSPIPSIYTYL